MKPFNLQEALAGKKVVTRENTEVRQFTEFQCNGAYRLAGVVDGEIRRWTIMGEFTLTGQHPLDLFMASEKKSGWVNIYRFTEEISHCSRIYPCEQEALKHKGSDSIGPVEISWEE